MGEFVWLSVFRSVALVVSQLFCVGELFGKLLLAGTHVRMWFVYVRARLCPSLFFTSAHTFCKDGSLPWYLATAVDRLCVIHLYVYGLGMVSSQSTMG